MAMDNNKCAYVIFWGQEGENNVKQHNRQMLVGGKK